MGSIMTVRPCFMLLLSRANRPYAADTYSDAPLARNVHARSRDSRSSFDLDGADESDDLSPTAAAHFSRPWKVKPVTYAYDAAAERARQRGDDAGGHASGK